MPIHAWPCAAFAAAVLAAVPADAADALGSYDVKLDETSVSGVSSGAYMAVQFAVARSSLVVGVGAIGAGPYYCAQDSVKTALSSCMVGPPPQVGTLKATVDRWAAAGLVDDPAKLARQKVWIFNGYNDGVVKKPVSDALRDFYASYAAVANVGPANVFYRDDLNAAHALVTASFGQSCDRTGGEFINRCGDYDAAGILLQYIHGALNERRSGDAVTGKILAFRQTDFHRDPKSIGMDATGYAFVPAACAAQEPCRVHVVFHGCKQNASTIGSDYYTHAGYNEWADANHLIVLYPQTIASGKWYVPAKPYNPNGCWDWWGYTGEAYAQRGGAQIAAVEAMLRQLAKGYTGWKSRPPPASTPSLRAIDAAPSMLALAWALPADAKDFRLHRATDPGCAAFSEVDPARVQGRSYSDTGLAPSTRHCYRLTVVREGGATSSTPVVERTTPRARASCDPYFRSVYQHWREGRTHLRWLSTYADGSDQYVGATGPTSLVTEVLISQTRPGYFEVGKACP